MASVLDCHNLAIYRIYNTPARQKPVWQRLEADAVTRQQLPTKQYSFWNGHGPHAAEGGGYAQNVTFRKLTQPNPGAQRMEDPPVESLHRITLDRYRQKFPLEFYSAIRPHTETVSQTLRCDNAVKQHTWAVAISAW